MFQPHWSVSGYDIPSSNDLSIGQKTAVVVGAGPGGLMAALTLRDAGFDAVNVLDKRQAYTRQNVINLHPESLHVLKRLDLLELFIGCASELAEHCNDVFVGDRKIYASTDRGFDDPVDPGRSFDPDDIAEGFRNETLYSVTLADLQDVLTQAARSRGISIIAETSARLYHTPEDMFELELLRGPAFEASGRLCPDLIVISDGASSQLYQGAGGTYLSQESLWDGEAWVFGDYVCNPSRGSSRLMFEFSRDYEELTISNCIFLPHKNAVNVAVTVQDHAITPDEIRALIAAQAAKILQITGTSGASGEVVWHSNQPVVIAAKSAMHSHFGRNVVLVGDANGTNSPVAALGGTLCTSAYSYALRALVAEMESTGPELAMQRYDERIEACVKRWHTKVSEVRRMINVDMRHKIIGHARNAAGFPASAIMRSAP